MFGEVVSYASSLNPLLLVVYGGIFVALTTSLGSLIAIIFKKLPDWGLELSMAFGGGVMLVASFTSLILPAINIANIYIVMIGIMLGFFIIFLIEKYLPHEHIFLGYEGPKEFKHKLKHIWLMVIAIIIHNLPEGMAVGVSLVNDIKAGIATTLAIGIQDIPEGLAVALPLMFITRKVWIPVLIGVLSGLSELLTAFLGALIFSFFSSLLPLGLSMAGGAMIYVTVKEVFPEVYKSDKERLMTAGFLLGFLLMLFLDTVLG